MLFIHFKYDVIKIYFIGIIGIYLMVLYDFFQILSDFEGVIYIFFYSRPTQNKFL